MPAQHRILIVLDSAAGAMLGASATDEAGSPQPLDLAALSALAPEINTGSLARIAELEAALATATAPPASPPILSTLGAAFANLPDAVQKAFARDFAIVRSLIEGDRIDLAISHVEGLDVPAEIETTRAAIVEMLKA